MIKNAVIVATAVAVFAPRDRHEAAVLAIRVGALLIHLGLSVDPPGYDAGPLEDNDERDIETQPAALPVNVAFRAAAGK